MRRSSTEKDMTRKLSTEKDVTTLVKMRRSSTERDVMTLVKGSSEAMSLPPRRNSSRLHERRKSLPVEELHDDIQKINLHIARNNNKTYSHHRSNSSKTQYMLNTQRLNFLLQVLWIILQVTLAW